MLNRSNLVLIVILLIQVVLLAASVLIANSSESRPVEPILRDLLVDQVDSVTIADDLDTEVFLARGEDGWVLPEADDFPIDSPKVDELLRNLASLNTKRLIAANPANFSRLEVADDDFRRRITLVADSATQVLYLGGGAGVDTVYARSGAESQVYLGAGMDAWDASTQISNWINAGYVNVPQTDVMRISIDNPAGKFDFLRDGEAWSYQGLREGETFDDTRMSNILRNAASIRMLEPLGLTARDEYGIAEPTTIVEVVYRERVESEADEDADASETSDATESETEVEYDEFTYTLTFGGVQEDGNVVVKSSAEDYYVLVRESVLTAFRDISHADLLIPAEAQFEPADAPGG